MAERIHSYRDLRVYRAAFDAGMEIFHVSKKFPPEESFALTDQLRRSTRGVCNNIAEAWRKRRYPAAFVAKLSDAETEACESQVSLEFALPCGYIKNELFDRLYDTYDHILAQLVKMIDHPEKWLIKPSPIRRIAPSPIRGE